MSNFRDLIPELSDEHKKTGTLDTNDIAALIVHIAQLTSVLVLMEMKTNEWVEKHNKGITGGYWDCVKDAREILKELEWYNG